MISDKRKGTAVQSRPIGGRLKPVSASGLAVIALLSLCSAGCSQAGESKELLALDNAYRAGVLTADEYRAKKAVIESQAAASAALDKGLASGVLSQEEYQARKARLDSTAAGLAALEKARRDGVLSNTEYLAKKSALLALNDSASNQPAVPPTAPTPDSTPAPTFTPAPAPVPPPQAIATPAPQSARAPAPVNTVAPAAPAPSGDGHTYRMKMAKILDQQGFGSPLVSATLLIPSDWQSQGATTWNLKDKCNTISTTLRATGPDGRAFEIFPAYTWNWADDPTILKQTAAQTAKLGNHACDIMPPMGAADYLKQNLGKIRPNAKLAGIEPATKILKILQDRARQTEQASQGRFQQHVRPDAIRARIRYSLNGQPVEEWILVVTMITSTTGPAFNARAGKSTQSSTYNCRATMLAERAPQGQLDSNEKLFDLINSTYHVDPQWQGRVTQNALKIQQIRNKGIQDRANIVSKNAGDIRNIQQQAYENQQKGEAQSSAQFDQYLRGTETYQNPNTGEKVDLDSSYGHAWVSNTGEYLLSDQATFDPNTVSKDSWTPMEHSKP